MFSPCRVGCPDVCPVVLCQHKLVRRAGESITHAVAEESYDRSLAVKLRLTVVIHNAFTLSWHRELSISTHCGVSHNLYYGLVIH